MLHVLVVDIDDSKLDAATEMGADAVLNPGTDYAVASLQKMTDGGLRAVVDTVGAESTANLGIAALLKGGRYVIVGLFGGGASFSANDPATGYLGAGFLHWQPYGAESTDRTCKSWKGETLASIYPSFV